MLEDNIKSMLSACYSEELVESVLNSYKNAQKEYRIGNWQYLGNEIGQFIETARRMIEWKLDQKYTPMTKALPIFSEKVLQTYEANHPGISEAYRIIIPRCLYSMYCLRNKRGMIHKSDISPNKMDATVLLDNAKWVLAEFVRLSSDLSFEETVECIDSIMCKETSVVWDTGDTLRILDTKMVTENKILCLLYLKDMQSENALRSSIEYSNASYFRKILRTMHSKRLIEYNPDHCKISPLGIKAAEVLLAGK